ncbi:hypothetical protein DDB_G0293868 [Dictyostelium discoideum AX4]|uniref:Uncharacterized protein n=1 Tax=Dictyostelium discoideum TaxID=44689 RepID=Q54B71_DICDI|nr:hypothetical protein DDB_G0293868 [Dictyostelium discoideum AX4]EAL60505.1 hypothetical protein DDB_G0293868 [Dictyostelium discoideum AX4]|eukprot:XP_628917.1 hypothetical protein DDB_G0293868 [Dictyostelium discoideum AX4]
MNKLKFSFNRVQVFKRICYNKRSFCISTQKPIEFTLNNNNNNNYNNNNNSDSNNNPSITVPPTTILNNSNINNSNINNNNNNNINNNNEELSTKNQYIKLLNKIRDDYTGKMTTGEVEKYIQLEQNILESDELIDFHLGTFYAQGILVEKNNEIALEYFRKSADNNNNPKGQFAYGLSLILNNTENLFKPLFPTITNNNNNNNNDNNVLLGNGWVSINNNNEEEQFDYKKWLKEERKKSVLFKENLIKDEISERERIEKGLRYLHLSAIQNFSVAQFNLGLILLHGKFNIDKNEKQAIYWLDKASTDFDDVNSTLELGKYYLSSYSNDTLNNEEHLILALKYLIKGSSKLSDSESSFILGSTFINRDSNNQEEEEEQLIDSIKFLKLSIEQGNCKAPAFLASLYLDGVGGVGERDVDMFNHYLELGVERGDSVAMVILGEQYFRGENKREQSYKKALQLFIDASELGNSDAYINQGVCHFNGFGTNVDYSKAFYCYQNAFNLNNKSIPAISNLSNMYKLGLGVPKSPENSNYFNSLLIKINQELN